MELLRRRQERVARLRQSHRLDIPRQRAGESGFLRPESEYEVTRLVGVIDGCEGWYWSGRGRWRVDYHRSGGVWGSVFKAAEKEYCRSDASRGGDGGGHEKGVSSRTST